MSLIVTNLSFNAYLGRYVHRIAITNNRILALKGGQVTFRYQKSDTRDWKTKQFPANGATPQLRPQQENRAEKI